MQALLGDNFITREGEFSFSELEENQVICLYFSANWCPPCRIFTPVLVEFYNDVNYPDKRLEIIQVSSDKDESSFNEYISQLPWAAIPYGDPRNKALKSRFKITGIPILLLLNRDGSLAYGKARADVQNEGPPCFERWVDLVS